jgi:hypothetical protein
MMKIQPPIDFSEYAVERTRDFIGREWVFREIDKWLEDPAGSRVFLLVGGPGTGKTAILARLAQFSLGQASPDGCTRLAPGFLVYHHFCQAFQDATLNPVRFVEALSLALAQRYQPFAKALIEFKQGDKQITINATQTVTTASDGSQVQNVVIQNLNVGTLSSRVAFDLTVRRPLEVLCTPQFKGTVVALVDSLDEARTWREEENILTLLSETLDDPRDLPPQVRFVVACRPDERVMRTIGVAPSLDLIAAAPPDAQEVHRYASIRLAGAQLDATLRDGLASRLAAASAGNFLYARHVLDDWLARPAEISLESALDLPTGLSDIYAKFLRRELARDEERWEDRYQQLLGLLAVARDEGLLSATLVGASGKKSREVDNALRACAQYLAGTPPEGPFRIYHQSFRDFLLENSAYPVDPAEAHQALADFFAGEYAGRWQECQDMYALRYAPAHWAEAAELSAAEREAATQALIKLTQDPKYQRAFEQRFEDIPALTDYLHRAVKVAALNPKHDMLPWLIKAPKGYVEFHRDYLQAESVVKLAEEGKLEQAEARLRLFTDIDEDWQRAARLIIAWIGAERNASEAEQMRARVAAAGSAANVLSLLSERVKATLGHQEAFVFEQQQARSLHVAQEVVKRVSGQGFDRELLASVGASGALGPEMEMLGKRGYAAAVDAPILVNVARDQGGEGTALLDQYIDAHAGYNYVEYRNRSLWFVLHAVLRFHPEQEWVKQRLRKILVAALAGGGVDFREMMPLTALLVREAAIKRDARPEMDNWRSLALTAADRLQAKRGADDSWGNHKRRLTGLLELAGLLINDRPAADALFTRIRALPGGFAGFQAPAYLRLADALRACRMDASGLREGIIEEALRAAHHIQDYHFCARVTARCNALKRWHGTPLTGAGLAATVRRLASSSGDAEFAADHSVHEEYRYREKNNPDVLPIEDAQRADTLEHLVEVFQRPAVEFRRLNAQYGLTQTLEANTLVRVPDPGFAPLLAVHLAARTFADDALDDERGALVRALVPVAASNPTALDTLLSYLLIATQPEDPELLEDIVREAGPVVFGDVAPSTAQIGPDPVTPA